MVRAITTLLSSSMSLTSLFIMKFYMFIGPILPIDISIFNLFQHPFSNLVSPLIEGRALDSLVTLTLILETTIFRQTRLKQASLVR